MKLLEWRVRCEWCGAKVGEPCHRPEIPSDKYPDTVHRARVKLYDETYGGKKK